MMSHYRVIVGLGQSAPTVGWGSSLHAWLASANWIRGARCLTRRYRYGARGMPYRILLRQYSQNLEQCGEKFLRVLATKMHVSKFQ